MKNAGLILRKALLPPKPILFFIPTVAFTALIFIFVTEKEESWPAYPIYFMSAYSLAVLIAATPKIIKRIKTAIANNRTIHRVSSSAIGSRYLSDLKFRGRFSIYQGMIFNFLYARFRTIAGIRYMSVWFISIAVYYLVLGLMRAYLIFCFHRREIYGLSYEYLCCRRTAWLLLLLNIPMGGMILLMIQTNSSFSYPGYVIYLSALYTFYTMFTSVSNLVRYRRLGSPILSAAKVLNLVSAIMSVLGLQTAMISRFSTNGEEYRKLMNSITGVFVYGIVIIIAVYMILYAERNRKKAD